MHRYSTSSPIVLRTVVAMAGLWLASARVLTAQVSGLFPVVTDQDCKKAAHIVAKGKPEKKEDWAFDTIVRCPRDLGPAGAAAIRALRTETDTAVLFSSLAALGGIVDADVMAANLEVLQDRTASDAARAVAANALLFITNDGHTVVAYRELVATGANCRTARVYAGPPLTGTPLPAGYLDTIRAAVTSVAGAGTSSATVRSAASCVLQYLPGSP